MLTPVARVVLVATLAAAVLSGCGSDSNSGGTPSPTVSTVNSPSASPSPLLSGDQGEVVIPDVAPASAIPWDEVGPGWFVLGYDPERSEPTDNGTGWDLSSGETWLLSPTGEVYQGPPPPTDAFDVAFFQAGAEVWFALPSTGSSSGACEPFSCADIVSVNIRTGETRDPLESPYWPESLEATAGGSFLRMVECCDYSESTLVGADGRDTSFALAVSLFFPWLTPDGTALVWTDLDSEGPSVPLVRTFFSGEEEVVAQVSGFIEGWIDESTILIYSFDVDDGLKISNEQWFGFDLESGAATEWVPPIEGFDYLEPLTPGMWMWRLPGDSGAVITNNDGTFQVPLEDVSGYGNPLVSGDRLLVVDPWDPWMSDSAFEESDGWQRLTLVDLTTGDQTVIFNAPETGGRVIDVQPHARVYE